MSRVRLQPGLRVSDRGDASLQVGLHAGLRAVLADTLPHRELLTLLTHGIDADRLTGEQRTALARLEHAGVLVDVDQELAALRSRERARVEIVGTGPAVTGLTRLLTDAGLVPVDDRATLALVVGVGAEPSRDRIDRLVQADRPHLLVTAVAGRIRVGPCVVPGLTACVRCIDAHLTDRDPRHPLVVEQHTDVDSRDRPAPADLGLALAWAVRDLVRLVAGERPTTWSATVELGPQPPVVERWRRHPGCGCAWGDALAI